MTPNQRYRLLLRRTNLVFPSAGFSGWTTTAATVTAAQAASPFAPVATDAAILTENTTTTAHRTQKAVSAIGVVLDNTTYTASAYVKRINRNAMMHFRTKANKSVQAKFDLETGEWVLPDENFGVGGITRVGDNGWWRIWVTYSSETGATTPFAAIYLIDDTYTAPYQGLAATDGVYAWGVQLEQGDAPSDYIPTTSAAVTR
jgi:hypothetical protein